MNRIKRIRSLALVVKNGNAAAEEACLKVRCFLDERGVAYSLSLHPDDNMLRNLLPGADMILVFAGDGTMVSVARQSLDLGIPVAGVNFGRVGFLAELSADDWRVHLQRALDEGVMIERRMSLCWSLSRGEEVLRQGEVVNDVVVTRGKVARLVSLHLAVNGRPFIALRSDGLILSTPTGSSGYAGSAGGPLLLPALEAYVVAAICPYLSSFPPLVLNPETVFSVLVGEAAPDLYLTLDGQEAHPLAEGDRLNVWGGLGRVQVADFGLKNYFDRLRRAGFVQEAGGR